MLGTIALYRLIKFLYQLYYEELRIIQASELAVMCSVRHASSECRWSEGYEQTDQSRLSSFH